jgi:RNA polymerase sigma factor (sigma-70 family)
MRIRKTSPDRKPPPGVTSWRRRAAGSQVAATQAGQDIDAVVAALYRKHYRSLVQLAALLVSDPATAEDIVQDSFAGLHGRWHAQAGTDAALGYLRWSVVRGSRSAARPAGDAQAPCRAGADPRAGLPLQDSAVVSALRALPGRQREVLVLRHFAELSDAEIASATGMSAAAVSHHAALAMAALHTVLPLPGE